MSNENDFLTFAPTDTGTNLLSVADYTVATDRTDGNQPGVASSKLNNRAIRQSSFITSQLAQYISNILAQDVLDNGSASTILSQIYAALAPNDSFSIENVGIATSIGSSALTVAMKTEGGADASATQPIYIGFRSASITNGAFNIRSLNAALSLVVPAGATLGMVSAVSGSLNVYAMDNAGTIELGIINGILTEDVLQTSTAITSGSTSIGVLYSTNARSSVPVRLVGRIGITEATAGIWASNATALSVQPLLPHSSVQFTGTLTGCTTTVTGQVLGYKIGEMVTLYFPNMNGTSNSTSCTITGVPSMFWPKTTTRQVLIRIVNSVGATNLGLFQVDSSGNVTIFSDAGGDVWSSSGTKGLEGCSISYSTAG